MRRSELAESFDKFAKVFYQGKVDPRSLEEKLNIYFEKLQHVPSEVWEKVESDIIASNARFPLVLDLLCVSKNHANNFHSDKESSCDHPDCDEGLTWRYDLERNYQMYFLCENLNCNARRLRRSQGKWASLPKNKEKFLSHEEFMNYKIATSKKKDGLVSHGLNFISQHVPKHMQAEVAKMFVNEINLASEQYK